nr:hypothetical protein [Tanacetum cinerariifolium]
FNCSTNLITKSQRHVTVKENVSSNIVAASSTRLVHIARTRRLQPKGNTRNAKIPSTSKSSEVKKNVTIEDHRRTLLLSKNQKTMPFECNNIKLSIRNDKFEQPEEHNISISTTIVEVPKELPKVSMVNSSLKKLKFHLASFDMVAIEQHSVEKNKFQDKMKNILKDNERLLEQALSVDIVNIVVHDHVNSAYKTVNVCECCVPIEIEHQTDFIKKECYDTLFKKYNTLEKHYISLEVDNRLKKEIFQRNNSFSEQSAPTFAELFENN